MADGLVPALVKFGETLADGSVGTSKKLRVLNTLNDVKLTLTELSESGLGRIVSRLKSEPGELGQTARILVTKWKHLLQTYLNSESGNQSSSGGSRDNKDTQPLTQKINTKLHGITPTPSGNASGDDVGSPANGQKDVTPQFTPNQHDSQDSASRLQISPELRHPVKSSRAKHTAGQSVASTSSFDLNSPSATATISPDGRSLSTVPEASKPTGKRKSSDVPDSIDASSGMSFMESLCVGSTSTSHAARKKRPKTSKKELVISPKKPPLPRIPPETALRPSAEFTAEVLSSLNEEVDRPDIINRSRTDACSASKLMDNMDDGDLKFKSKKILWVPKTSRNLTHRLTHSAALMNGTPEKIDPESDFDPPSLIDLCLNVVERNLSRVDHVGQVPYELLGRALRHASPTELAHIEQYNPQFVGCSDDLWQRHVQREFQHSKEQTPRAGETWCEFYNRLAKDEMKRLDCIINRSARKIKEEMEARRTTRTTEAIPPREFQRRARQSGHLPSRSSCSSSSSSRPGNLHPFGRPTNVSRPQNVSTTGSHQTGAVVSHSSGVSNAPGAKPGGLLNKLRKQFNSGRLR